MSVLLVEGLTVNAVVGTRVARSRTGDIARAYSGRLRHDTRDVFREYAVTTSPVDSDTRDALEAILRSPGPILLSGTELGGSSYFYVTSAQTEAHAASWWSFSFTVKEALYWDNPVLTLLHGDALDEDYTFTRTTGGSYVSSSGVVTDAATNALRVDWTDLGATEAWDGEPGVRIPRILTEPAHTNLIPNDTLTAWNQVGGGTVTVTAVDDPADGSVAYNIDGDGLGSSSQGIWAALTYTGNGVKAVMAVVREADTPSTGACRLGIWDGTAPAWRLLVDFSWTDGSPDITIDATTPNAVYLGKRYIGNGYWAVYLQTESVTAANVHRCYIYATEGTTAAYAGSIDVYRVNTYNDDDPSWSIMAAAEARTVDDLEIPCAINPKDPLTIYAHFTALSFSAAGFVLSIGGAATSEGNIEIYYTGGKLNGRANCGQSGSIAAGVGSTASLTALSPGDDIEVCLQHSGDDAILTLYQSLNGGDVEASGTGTGFFYNNAMPSSFTNGMFVGKNYTSGPWNAHLFKTICVARGTRTLAEMRAMSLQRRHYRSAS